MAVDTPAKIAIVGAGPIGLEAALYARFLGYDVDVFERGQVAEHVLRWGHVRMFSPFRMNRSPLGLAALAAQDAAWRPPGDEALLTGREWTDRYLLPLAQSDLLVDSIHQQTEVLNVGRDGLVRDELAGDEARGDPDFRLLVQDNLGERFTTADVVIDASGVLDQPNWLGPGGLPAIGERENRERIEYGWPDVLGRERDRYAGQRVLVVGSGHSAATTVVNLARLSEEAPDTRITWITRSAGHAEGEPAGTSAKNVGPVQVIADDRLPARKELAEAANRLAAGESQHVTHWPGAMIERVRWKEEAGRFSLRFSRAPEEKLKVERIIANVGHRPDGRLYSELQVRERTAAGDGPTTLMQPEPDFYLLGAKSAGPNSDFLFSTGLEQIRELFAVIGDRAELNLYATAGGIRS